MQELIVFYSLLSIPGLMGLGYVLYLYRKHKQAKSKSSVLKGEEIIIAKAGKPTARLVPLAEKSHFIRRPGSMKGGITIADDFDAPLPDDIQAGFEGR